MRSTSLDAIDAIEAFCNQCATNPPKGRHLSAEEKRIMDVASIRIGQFTAKEIAKIRGVHWQRVYEWVDEVEDQIAVMARETRGQRRTGAELN